MTVRKATLEDKLDLTFLIKQFLKETSYPFKVDTDKLLGSFEQIIEHENFIVLVLEDQGDISGTLVGGVTQPLFSHDIVASELAWFVTPEKRGSKDSLKLLKQYEDWCKEKGCKFITMVDIDPYDDLGKFYKAKGYSLTEKTYVKEL